MSTISKFPRGLLALLGLQNFGENVKRVSPELVQVVDVRDQYLSETILGVAGITAAPVAGFNAVTTPSATCTVPAGFTWALYGMSAALFTEAGVTASVAPAILVQGQYRVLMAEAVDVAAGEFRWSSVVFPRPVFLPSGSQLGAYLANLVGVPTAASNIEVNALIASLRS